MSKSAFSFIGGLLFLSSPLLANEGELALAHPSEEVFTPNVTNDEEAFLVRRIAEFWKDGDFNIVKVQIQEFFDKYPDSGLRDYFHGILGDLYLQEGQIDEALAAYNEVDDAKIYEKILINKLHCLYEKNDYAALQSEGEPNLRFYREDARFDELKFLVAESQFRQAIAMEKGDEQMELISKSQPMYEDLLVSNYSDVSQFALAEIHHLKGDHEEAAMLYRELAQKHPTDREDLLFQAASLEAHFAPKEAIMTFTTIVEDKGARAHEALFNRLILLFQTEQYRSVIADVEEARGAVPESYEATFNYIVGKSYFAIENYQDASEPIGQFIASESESTEQLKNALLIQMTCAQNLTDEPLFDQSLQKMEIHFPEDSELPKAIFMHAMLCKETGNLAQTKVKLEHIKETYPDFEDQESFLFEYGLAAHQSDEWENSYGTYETYLANFSDSHRSESAWKLFLSSALHLFELEDHPYTKEQFYGDLGRILHNETLFSHDELKEYRLLYAKTAYELEKYQEALDYTHEFILASLNEEIDREALAEANYLAALCHHQMQDDNFAFCNHLENALKLNPENYQNATTHLHLYNGYIRNEDHIDLAAHHLYEAISLGDQPVKPTNKLWLANFYYNQAKSYLDTNWKRSPNDNADVEAQVERATGLFASVLKENDTLVVLEEKTLAYESEALKFAELLGKKGDQAGRLAVVSALVEQQNTNGDLDWQYKKHALFELANSYKSLGDGEKALETFTFIKNTGTELPTSMSHMATLESAQIQFNLLDKSLKSESSEEILVILNQLKELQIRKNILSEPVHMEAALAYAEIRADLAEASDQDARYLFFLNRMKEDFTSTFDTIGSEYHAALEHNEGKHQMYGSYMKFVDAEIYRVQAKQKAQSDEAGAAEELNENALALLSEIKESQGTTKELHKRTMERIEEINQQSHY